MIATSEIPQWTPAAAGILAQFLATPTGSAFIANLGMRRPSLQPGNFDLTTRAIAGAEVAGFERCFSTISMLASVTEEKPEPINENYPSLDDDSAWGDGKKQTP